MIDPNIYIDFLPAEWSNLISDWRFWLIVIVMIFLTLWVFLGGGDHQFSGLSILANDERISEIISLPNNRKNNNRKTRKHITKDIKRWENLQNPETDPISSPQRIARMKSMASGKPVREPKRIKVPVVKESDVKTEKIPIISNKKTTTTVNPKKSSLKPYKSGRTRSQGETLCAQAMYQIYGVPFDTYRPDFLKNPLTGENLELDCYNPNIEIIIEYEDCEYQFNGIAVEYNGIQHYVWPNFTGQTKKEFLNQVGRDKIKRELCDENRIYLITVPYNLPMDLIKDYIIYYLPENVLERGDY